MKFPKGYKLNVIDKAELYAVNYSEQNSTGRRPESITLSEDQMKEFHACSKAHCIKDEMVKKNRLLGMDVLVSDIGLSIKD